VPTADLLFNTSAAHIDEDGEQADFYGYIDKKLSEFPFLVPRAKTKKNCDIRQIFFVLKKNWRAKVQAY